MAIRAIARIYLKVSRRLIQFIVDENRAERAKIISKQWRKENGNTRERIGNKAWAKVIREHRQYKQSIKEKLL